MPNSSRLLSPDGADLSVVLPTFRYLTAATQDRSHRRFCNEGGTSSAGPLADAANCSGELRESGAAELNRMYGATVDELLSAFQHFEIGGKSFLVRRLSARASSGLRRLSPGKDSDVDSQSVDTSVHPAFAKFAFAAHLATTRQRSSGDDTRNRALAWLDKTGDLFDACVRAYNDEETNEEERQSYASQLHAQIAAFKAITESNDVQLLSRNPTTEEPPSTAELTARGIDADVENLLRSVS